MTLLNSDPANDFSGGLRYVMKKHRATRLHFDLRLEFNGVLLSWALPVGPSCFPGVCREAIEMEDHRLENILFEGVHKTGPIMVWDQGSWSPQPDSKDIESSLQKGFLRFTLHGERLGGEWTLVRDQLSSRGYRSKWNLCKEIDKFAAHPGDECILQQWQISILPQGRNMEEIERDWAYPPPRRAGQANLFESVLLEQ